MLFQLFQYNHFFNDSTVKTYLTKCLGTNNQSGNFKLLSNFMVENVGKQRSQWGTNVVPAYSSSIFKLDLYIYFFKISREKVILVVGAYIVMKASLSIYKPFILEKILCHVLGFIKPNSRAFPHCLCQVAYITEQENDQSNNFKMCSNGIYCVHLNYLDI